jgi:hypothetical protein
MPVGDAGGHDGSEAVGQLADEPSDPPHRPTAARAVARLQLLPQGWVFISKISARPAQTPRSDAFVKEPEERGPNQEPGHLVT